jgi:hypothetical protein
MEFNMRNRSKLLLAALTATVVMGLAVDASATRIESSSQRFRIQWTTARPLIFATTGGIRVSCPVTLEGSFHSRTISKVSGQLIGYTTRAQVGSGEPPCKGGTARANTETLPWHQQYNGFIGTLPRIRGIIQTLVGSRFEVLTGGLNCHPTTTQREPAAGTTTVNETTGAVIGFEPNSEFTIALTEGFCAFGGRSFFTGPAASVDNGSNTTIIVRLVR